MDMEARVIAQDHAALRLWLRMLTCTQMIEKQVRQRLREHFATTLPRFDLMAQLEREPAGIKMNLLSARMMVTSGNITAIVDQLETEQWVERVAVPHDKRATLIRLTVKGRRGFNAMAREHEEWIVESLAGLSKSETAQLHGLLGKLKLHMQENR
jgi:DNA-binding MarR family transcriptional regulator